jgi:hypothetical protein
MKYRAVIKKVGNWWIGWLIDLPGVKGQVLKYDFIKPSNVTAKHPLEGSCNVARGKGVK